MHVGPIAAEHLASWLEDRLNGAGVTAPGVGARIVAAAGPRTQDVMLLARMLWFRCSGNGRAGEKDVTEAMTEIVTGAEASLRRSWEVLMTSQQPLLRAIAAGAGQLHATEHMSATIWARPPP